jgi:hypothetical protein
MPDSLRPLNIVDQCEAVHAALCARAAGAELDAGQVEALGWYDSLPPLSEEFEQAAVSAAARFRPPTPPEPVMPDMTELEQDILEAERRGADPEVERRLAELCETTPAPPTPAPLPAPTAELMPKAPPQQTPGFVRTSDGSVLIQLDMKPPDHFSW